jgi:hypothetical protein
MLDRNATADLFKHTLSRIPTLLGRLAYLSSLRDTNSGVYKHHGLAAVFGREDSKKALRDAHETVFQEWLNLSLQVRHADATEYLEGLPDAREDVLKHWKRVRVQRGFLPDSAKKSESTLFSEEFELLLQILSSPTANGGRA